MSPERMGMGRDPSGGIAQNPEEMKFFKKEKPAQVKGTEKDWFAGKSYPKGTEIIMDKDHEDQGDEGSMDKAA